MRENSLRKISKKQFDKVLIALLGENHIAMTGITHVTMKAGKCAILNDSYYADSKALKLIGQAPKRQKRRSY